MRSRRTRRDERRKAPLACDQPDWTPLIDITFQLVVFLLVAQDLTQKETEPVELPTAHFAQRQESADGFFVNLVHAGDDEPPRMVVRGRQYDLPALKRLLTTIADVEPRDADGISTSTVQIRADRRVPWRHVQLVLQTCADERVKIRQVQFGARDPDAPENR